MPLKSVFALLLALSLTLTAILSGCDSVLRDPLSSSDISSTESEESASPDTSETISSGAEETTGLSDTSTDATSSEDTESDSETITETSHEHHYLSETVEPTCTQKGTTVYTCNCGDTYTEETEAAGHRYGKWVVTKEPTCQEKGKQKRTCTVCGKSATQTLDKTEHDYAEPTCSRPYLCVLCEEIDKSPLGHEWDEGVWSNQNSETGEGDITYTCAVCQEVKTITIDKNIPDSMLNTSILRSLEYLGYDVQGQLADGTLFSVYGSFELSEQYRSPVFYDENGEGGLEGLNTVSDSSSPTGKLPDLNKFRKRGLICASFTAYYLFNYLPNVENVDTSEIQETFTYYTDNGYHYRAVLTWRLALEDLAKEGTIEKIGTSLDTVDRTKLSAGDIILFKNPRYSYSHIAIYAGTFKGEDYVVHCTYGRGVEINTLSAIADPYGDGEIQGATPIGFYHWEPENT